MELGRKASFSSDVEFGSSSISESDVSTAPSSLQTIVRSPYKNPQNNGIGITAISPTQHLISNGAHPTGLNSLSSECSDLSPPTTPVPHPQPPIATVTTHTLSSLIPTRRTSQPSTASAIPHLTKNQHSGLGSLKKLVGSTVAKDDHSDLDSVQNHAQNLRKVSEQLLNNPRTRQSFTGGNVALPGVGIPVMNSRPGSLAR